MTTSHLAALFGFLFVAAWAALGFGDAILCLLGAAAFWAVAAFYHGELDVSALQQRAVRSRGAPSPPSPPRRGTRVR